MHSITVWYIGAYRDHQTVLFQPVAKFNPYMTTDELVRWVMRRFPNVTEVMAHDRRGRLIVHVTPERVRSLVDAR